jgi:hypothetical protein
MPFTVHPVGLLVLLIVAFWIWMLVDCISNKSLTSIQKCIWFICILFFPLTGALIYFFFGRSKKKAAPPLSQPNPSWQLQTDQPYERGYQAQPPLPRYQPVEQPISPEQPESTNYEQPLVLYPEQSQSDTW